MPHILVVDDEEAIRELVRRGLQLDGHTVELACDGADALDIIASRPTDFDLLLTDIRMPMMDGIALALTVGRDYPTLTILLMTGYADQRERAANLELLIHDVVTKPFSLAQIRDAVTDALAARKAA
ncbi:response regulator [Agaricicola taiwanensis]|uniref:Response regulator n=1 Tax=Agaricicola taiwanensis TaxID=591372 RepID=A0A8J2YKI0_9RHOB|nr:response regulator [Agaricicola taiwanensis]GGE51138.1 response regulator [Agaricicola taiwanensis]